MDAVDPIQLAREVDALVDALDAERWRHVAGRRPEPELVPLFQGRSRAAHRETVAALRASGHAALAGRVAALRAERAAAEAEERWRAAEARATGLGPEGRLAIVDAELAIPREREPSRRGAIARAAAEGCEAAARDREAAAETRARARAEGGLAPDWRAVVEGDALLAATDAAWSEVLAWALRTEELPPAAPRGDLRRADLLRALSPGRFGGGFQPGMLPLALREIAGTLRLDLSRLTVDDEPRPGKWPGVHVFGARLSLRHRGGFPDWLDALDGVGRALAASHRPPSERDAAFGHALGWALSAILLEPRFLADRCDVPRRELPDLVRAMRLRRVFALRARAAAFRIASEVERGTSGLAWREGYWEAMTHALGAEWDGVRAARDADGPAHGAALAGAGQGEALRRMLVERFDEDWWRNPRTAEGLAGLLAAGSLPPGEAATPSAAGEALAAALGG